MKLKELFKPTLIVCPVYLYINQDYVFMFSIGPDAHTLAKEQALHDYGDYYVKEIFPVRYKGSGGAIGIDLSETKN